METKLKNLPVLDLSPEINSLWNDLTGAIEGVLRSAQFIMGPNVKAFEQEVAQYLGARHAIGVNSGTDALVIGLLAAGIKPGDEVITTSFSFFATAEAIDQVGAVAVFADIDPITMNIDPEEAAKKITSRTKALLPVHLYGQSAAFDPLLDLAERHGLRIVEDVAQAFGGRYYERKLGTIGDVGAYSFFPSKNLGAYGDGGLIATNDDAMAETARMLRVHGARRKYYNEVVGYNSRLDEIQAAILRVKLPHIDEWIDGRRDAARRYGTLLEGMEGIVIPREMPEARHGYHQYTIRVKGGRRDAVQRGLTEQGIGSMVYYPVPIHKLPIYAGRNLSLPLSEEAAGEVLSLPIWPQITQEQQQRVTEGLRAALGTA